MVDSPPTDWLISNIRRCLDSGRTKFALVPDNSMAHALVEIIGKLAASRKFQCRLWEFEVSGTELPATCLNSSTCKELVEWLPEVLIVCEDEGKVALLSALNRLAWLTYPEVIIFGSDHTRQNQRMAEALECEAGEQSHAVGYCYAKANILELLKHYTDIGKTGTIIELGVYRGGTLLLIAQMLEALGNKGNRLIGFDTWSGFPRQRSLLDMYSDSSYVYTDYGAISKRLGSKGIELVRGDIVDTISSLPNESLLLTFIDTDNYSPVERALPEIARQTLNGGAIVFDHYFAHEEYNDAFGEGVAAAEFFSRNPNFLNLSGTGVFLKMA